MKTVPASVVIAGLLLCFSTMPAATEDPPPSFAEVVEKTAAKLPAGGIVAAEVDHGSVRYAGAGKFAPRDGGAPERVIFEIGSITKVFTGLLLAETVNEGKARLDDPIAKYLPADLKLAPEVAAITLEQLATHTSGLPRLPDNLKPADPLDPYADYDVPQMYAFLSSYHPAKPAPQPADYSNFGMGLLGHLLALIHGKSYAELVAERITGPLGMKDTVIELDADQQARFAVPYSGATAVKPWRVPGLAGAGALRSTAADLARFEIALMTPGESPLQQAWALACQPRAEMNGEQIGLAIMIGKHHGALSYSHGGGTGGFRSHLEFSPATQRGQVVLLNSDALEGAALLTAGAPGAARQEAPLPPAKTADYVGVYALNARTKFTVLPAASGRLQIRLTGQPFAPVFFAGHDRFFARVAAADFQFARDAGGRVESLTLLQNGRELLAKRVDEPLPTVLPTTEAELQQYVGTYDLKPGAQFTLAVHLKTLFAQLTGQPPFPVFKDRADHFVYDVVEAALTFERGADGRVAALVLHQNGRDQRATRIP